jgi:hypothetical protein
VRKDDRFGLLGVEYGLGRFTDTISSLLGIFRGDRERYSLCVLCGSFIYMDDLRIECRLRRLDE